MPYDEPLSMAVCPACSTPVYRVKVGGLEYTANLTSLDAQTAMAEVLAGRTLYRLLFVDGSPLSIRRADSRVLAKLHGPVEDRPYLVAEHPCAAVSRPLTPSPASGTGGPGKAPQTGVQSLAGRTAPSSGPQAGDAPVRTAEHPRSDAPRCSGCGEPCADGTYASIAVGEMTVWAAHVAECPQEGRNGA